MELHYCLLQWSGLPEQHGHGEQLLGAGEENTGSSQTAPAQGVLCGVTPPVFQCGIPKQTSQPAEERVSVCT